MSRKYCSIGMGDWVEVGNTGAPDGTPVVNGDVYPCCPGWLLDKDGNDGYVFGNLFKESWEEVWNGKKAKSFRESILSGDFTYCNDGVCPHLQNVHSNPNVGSEDSAPAVRKIEDIELLYKERGEHHRNIIENNLVTMKHAPMVVKLDYDKSCNLSCPSCRVDLQTANREELVLAQKIQNYLIESVIKRGAKKLYVTGTGDPFGSKTLRSFLLDFKKENFTSVEGIRLHTNGILWTKELWSKMEGLHGVVNDAEVSIDAGTKETYEKIRRGGDWDILMENLLYIPTQVNWFGLSMVVQKTNYQEIPHLIKLRQRLIESTGNKNIYLYFSKITDWKTYSKETYEELAVWKSNHIEHKKFLKILNENINKNDWQDRFIGTNMTELLI